MLTFSIYDNLFQNSFALNRLTDLRHAQKWALPKSGFPGFGILGANPESLDPGCFKVNSFRFAEHRGFRWRFYHLKFKQGNPPAYRRGSPLIQIKMSNVGINLHRHTAAKSAAFFSARKKVD